MSVTGIPTAGPPARHVAAVVVGNALEFYDFLIYAFFAVQIGHAFFPSHDPTSSLLMSLATFGAGFLMRPIGGIVIGRMGDRVGRKPAMLLSFACMGVAMIGLAITPTYASIGLAAPVIVILLRLLQGFALGGEVGPTTAFLVEAAPAHRRGVYTSLQFASQGVAVLSAGLVGLVLARTLEPQALHDWGWRIAFIVGTLIVPFGLIIRRRLPETLHRQVAASPSPADTAGRRSTLRIAGLGLVMMAGGTIATYVMTYLGTFATTTLHLPPDVAFGAIVILGLCDMFLTPFSGWLSDRHGRRTVMIPAFLALFVLTVPAFALLTRNATSATLFAATLVLGGLRSMGIAPALVTLTEALPAHERSATLAITYAVAIATFGGTAQFIVAWLISVTGNPLSPAWYMTLAVGIGLAGMFAMHETAPVRTDAGARGRLAEASAA